MITEARYATHGTHIVAFATNDYVEASSSTDSRDSALSVVRADPRRRAGVPVELSHLMPAVDRLLNVRRPADGSYLPDDMLRIACEVLSAIDDEAPAPHVSATSDGGVQFEWWENGVGVEIEIEPDGTILTLLDDLGSISTAEVGRRDLSLLRAVTARARR